MSESFEIQICHALVGSPNRSDRSAHRGWLNSISDVSDAWLLVIISRRKWKEFAIIESRYNPCSWFWFVFEKMPFLEWLSLAEDSYSPMNLECPTLCDFTPYRCNCCWDSEIEKEWFWRSSHGKRDSSETNDFFGVQVNCRQYIRSKLKALKFLSEIKVLVHEQLLRFATVKIRQLLLNVRDGTWQIADWP